MEKIVGSRVGHLVADDNVGLDVGFEAGCIDGVELGDDDGCVIGRDVGKFCGCDEGRDEG